MTEGLQLERPLDRYNWMARRVSSRWRNCCCYTTTVQVDDQGQQSKGADQQIPPNLPELAIDHLRPPSAASQCRSSRPSRTTPTSRGTRSSTAVAGVSHLVLQRQPRLCTDRDALSRTQRVRRITTLASVWLPRRRTSTHRQSTASSSASPTRTSSARYAGSNTCIVYMADESTL